MKTMPVFPEGEPSFVEELRRPPERRVRWDWNLRSGDGELDLRQGMFLQTEYPDPERLLETAYGDFQHFLEENRISGKSVKIAVKHSADLSGEDFAWTVTAEGVLLEGGGTEAIRRGMYHLIAHLRSQTHPGLPLQQRTIVHYWLKNRISRCFFSPIKRAPFFRDELLDDQEYYPENYLSRLAESGINGLWITIVLKEMDNSADGCRRMEKLRRNIRRCRRYGIRIWVFCIEPEAWSEENPLREEDSELAGPEVYGRWQSYCIASRKAADRLHDSVYDLFQRAPGLGGMITISLGERITGCLSSTSIFSDGSIPCARRCGLTPGEIAGRILQSMEAGMKEAAPEARLISWLYMPHPDQVSEWIYELPEGMPPDVIMMANFESGCHSRQLGRMRNGGDYWLSTAGPSERFRLLAEHRRPYPIAAKIQVGCSHECATVPYVPVPGQLYRKYRSMRNLGVETVMQCWFFGNYPGVMNNAAGLLATDAVDLDEQQFLVRLAQPDWGGDAEKMAEIWTLFAAAYEYYPLDIQFQYYGPMHDGPVWPLHLHPVHRRLPQSWMPYPEPAGDALGECHYEFTLGETVALTGRMSEIWHEGVEKMRKVMEHFTGEQNSEKDFSVAQALDLQFSSGHDILRFYALRNQWLASGSGIYVPQMKKIIEKEIENSGALMDLCRKDSRLGYHSEAGVFKYFPEKLQWRIDQLKDLLTKPFELPEPEKALQLDHIYESGKMSCKVESDGEYLLVKVICRNRERKDECLRFFISDRWNASMPWYDLIVRRDGRAPDDGIERQTVSRPRPGAIRDIRQIAEAFQKSEDGLWQVKLRIPYAVCEYDRYFRLGIQHDTIRLFGDELPGDVMENFPSGKYHQEDRLYLSFYSPEKLALFAFDEQEPGNGRA